MRHLLACLAILAAFNLSAQWNANADVDQDGCVGVGDVLEILSVFGSCEPTWQCGDSLEYYNYWYETVLIGNQCWFAENLRTEQYQNGDSLLSQPAPSIWQNTNEGSQSVFGLGIEDGWVCPGPPDWWTPTFDECNPVEYLELCGRIYNGHAATDERNLCPANWHVAAAAELDTLFAIAENMAAANPTGPDAPELLKSTEHWVLDLNGVNALGFNAVPAGDIDVASYPYQGAFGSYAFFWVNDEDGIGYSINRSDGFNSGPAFNLQRGFSVRCVLD